MAQTPQETPNKKPVDIKARDLSIVWSSDSRYWQWKSEQTGAEDVEVAELIDVCWLQVDGKYETTNLKKGKHAVAFKVKLKDNLEMNGPVTLKLTGPDGTPPKQNVELKDLPKNQEIDLKVGEFKNVPKTGHFVKFSLTGPDGTSWKQGLVVIGATICPL